MRELEIAALMCSKVCHDLISPVGALANGLEILTEEEDSGMRDEAIALIDSSARQAAAKLQFARMAFGAAKSTGEDADLEQTEPLARGVLETSKTALDWDLPVASWPKDRVRLMLNVMVLANDAIPRGGVLRVSLPDDGTADTVTIEATGPRAAVPEGVRFLEDGMSADAVDLDARSIQPFTARLLAERIGAGISWTAAEEQVTFTLQFAAA